MQHKKEIWVVGIEHELTKSPIRRIAWRIVLLIVCGVLYLFGQLPDIIKIGLFFVSLFTFLYILYFITYFERSPDYLAYYLYKIGDELSDFERDPNYLKRNRNYLKNCGMQILYILGTEMADLRGRDFAKGIVDFAYNLGSIILRLNNIYSKNHTNDAINEKMERMSSEPYITEKEFLSSNIIDLANQIHKEHSTLTPTHVELTNKILNELKDIPEKPFSKSFKSHLSEEWNRLPYKSKYLILGATSFVIFFTIFSQILIYYKQEEAYSYALASSVVITTFILAKLSGERLQMK